MAKIPARTPSRPAGRQNGRPLPAPVTAPARPSRELPLKVRARKMVWHNLHRYRAGDVFVLRSRGDFKPKCMEIVGEEVPEHYTLPREAQAREQRAIARGDLPKLQPNAADAEQPASPLDGE